MFVCAIAWIGLAIIFTSCSAPLASSTVPAATFPSEVTRLQPGDAATARRVRTTFPLLNGTFRIEVRDGGATVGRVTGMYSGEALQPDSGNASSALSLRVQNATGRASSVVALEGKGNGVFVGEGDFTLSLSLALSAQNGTRQAKVRGNARISCSAAGLILVTMHGTGTVPRLGDIAVELRHEVGNTACF